jgi:alginate O-acetyltransferase complex protein AlgI
MWWMYIGVKQNPVKISCMWGLYILYFPQLIAGPIVRYADVDAQIEQREINAEGIRLGVRRFIIGLAKKKSF